VVANINRRHRWGWG